jgi:transposase
MTRGVAVYFAVGAFDLRGAFDRLAGITQQVLGLDPASGALFLFVNRRKNRLKALWWDRNGYTILYKRLSKSTFNVVQAPASKAAYVEISATDFALLIAGLPIESSADRLH